MVEKVEPIPNPGTRRTTVADPKTGLEEARIWHGVSEEKWRRMGVRGQERLYDRYVRHLHRSARGRP